MSHPVVAECDLVLDGGIVVTMDESRPLIHRGTVAISGDTIVAVGDSSEASFAAKRRVDCTDKIVMPGLIDCHTHLFQSLGRGLGEGLSLVSWIREFMWPYAAAITPEDATIAAQLGAIEAARSGTTTVLDNHYAPADLDTTLSVAHAIETVGLRGAVARGMWGPLTDIARRHLAESLFKYSVADEVDMTRDGINTRPPGSQVEIWPSAIMIAYVDQDLVRRSVELAVEMGTGWHTHCSEIELDPQVYLEAFGVRPIEWLHREGLLESHGTIAHGIWLDDQEVERLGTTSTGIAYCPVSHQYLPLGIMRLRSLRDSGAVVGLGTDGPAAGHRQDLFECMKHGILLQRAHTLNPLVSNAPEALEMATKAAADYMGIHAGVLAPGRLADIAVVGVNRPHLQPLSDPIATLVYAARGSDVDMTIVNGRVIYEDGKCSLVDEQSVMDEAGARSRELLLRAGISAPLL